MQNSGSVELHIHPHAAEETKIIHQEFNFSPIFGLLPEINLLLVSVWYMLNNYSSQCQREIWIFTSTSVNNC